MTRGENDARGEPHQRRRDDARLEQVIAEQAALREEQAALRADIQRNTDLTMKVQQSVQKVDKNTADLVALMQGGKVTMSLFRIVGKIAIWIGGVAGAALAVWALIYAITHGGPPSIELPGPPHH